MDFYINDRELSDEFLIIDVTSEEVIIGVATMRKWRIRLDFENEKAVCEQKASRLMLK